MISEVVIRVYGTKPLRAGANDDWWDLDVDQETSPLKLNISSIQVNNLGTNYGIGSQQFALPNTANNNDFFDYAFDINSEDAGTTLQKSFTCQILIDGGVVASGKLYFDSVITDNQGDVIYNCSFNDAVPGFSTQIKDTLISDLDWSAYDHTFSITNITSSWEEDLFSGDIIYPNVEYGYPKDTEGYSIAYNRFETSNVVSTSNILPPNIFKPAVKAKVVWDKIFDSIGFEYQSDFISGVSTPFGDTTATFDDLYMLMTADNNLGPKIDTPVGDAQHYADLDNVSLPYATLGVDTIDVPIATIVQGASNENELYDPLDFLNLATTNTINIPLNGTYRIAPACEFRFTFAGNYIIKFKTLVNGTDTTTATLLSGVQTTGTEFLNDFLYIDLDLQAGDTLECFWEITKFASGDVTIRISDLYFGIDNLLYDNGNVVMSSQFGDLKAVDFIKGIQEQFNLVFWADTENPNKVYIEPYNTYIESGNVLDWSDKVDYSQKWEITHPASGIEKEIKYKNKDDEDAGNKWWRENYEKTFGSYTYTAQSDYASGQKVIGERFFAPTTMRRIPNSVVGGENTNMTIPFLSSNEDNGRGKPSIIKFKPRLLFKQGIKTLDRWYTVGGDAFNTYYQMAPITSMYVDDVKFDLNFSSYNYWWGSDDVSNYNHYTEADSFNIFWANYINNIYRPSARKLKCNIKFNPTDLFTFKLNDVIFIDGQTYKIDNISGFDLLNPASIQVELVKLLYPLQYKPIYVVPPSGNPYEPNEDTGIEWTFTPNPANGFQFEAVDINDNTTIISASNVPKILIGQDGFIISGSGDDAVIWGEYPWGKQSSAGPTAVELQQGNTTNNVAPASLTGEIIGSDNTLDSTENLVVVGNNNTIGVNSDDLVVIGDGMDISNAGANKSMFLGNDSITIDVSSVDTSTKNTLFGGNDTWTNTSTTYDASLNHSLVFSNDTTTQNNSKLDNTIVLGNETFTFNSSQMAYSAFIANRNTSVGAGLFTPGTTTTGITLINNNVSNFRANGAGNKQHFGANNAGSTFNTEDGGNNAFINNTNTDFENFTLSAPTKNILLNNDNLDITAGGNSEQSAYINNDSVTFSNTFTFSTAINNQSMTLTGNASQKAVINRDVDLDFSDYGGANAFRYSFIGNADINNYDNNNLSTATTGLTDEAVIMRNTANYGREIGGVRSYTLSNGAGQNLLFDENIVILQWTGGAGSATLSIPTSTNDDGRIIKFVCGPGITATQTITMSDAGGYNINGAGTFVFNTPYEAITIVKVSNSIGWYILAKNP